MMVTLCANLARPQGPAVWSNAHLGVAMKVFISAMNIYNQLTLRNLVNKDKINYAAQVRGSVISKALCSLSSSKENSLTWYSPTLYKSVESHWL